MKEAIYHFKGAICIGGKGNLTFYKTKNFLVDRGWDEKVYLAHNENIITMFFVKGNTPYVCLRPETTYDKKICRSLFRLFGNSIPYNGGKCVVNIRQKYEAIKDGSI